MTVSWWGVVNQSKLPLMHTEFIPWDGEMFSAVVTDIEDNVVVLKDDASGGEVLTVGKQ